MEQVEHPTAKLLSLQLLASLGLNPAQVQLISGFIDTYLKLNPQETALFAEQVASIEPRQQEGVMQIVTSWMEQGIEQGKKQEAVLLEFLGQILLQSCSDAHCSDDKPMLNFQGHRNHRETLVLHGLQ